MHIPDGFLDIKTAVGTGILAAAVIIPTFVKLRVHPRTVPLIGLGAAFVFAAQMINFPVAKGTSGHLLGATLMANVLGLPSAILIMTTVLVTQTFMFADGGVTALGANIINMAIIAPTVGYFLAKKLRKILGDPLGMYAGVCFGGWASTIAAAFACAAELKISGTIKSNLVFPIMMGIHAIIGLSEGVISALLVATLHRLFPHLLKLQEKPSQTPARHAIGFGFAAVIGLVIIGTPVACGWPDGLERVAHNFGFIEKASDKPIFPAPAQDYNLKLGDVNLGLLGTILAGVFGTLLVYGLSLFVATRLARQTHYEKSNTQT
jgi:cobalt/nickel transport system permease protein